MAILETTLGFSVQCQKSALVAACGSTITADGALTAIQATQVAYRAGVNEADFVDDDPWQRTELVTTLALADPVPKGAQV